MSQQRREQSPRQGSNDSHQSPASTSNMVLYPGQHYVCVCAYMRASISFFMSLVYLEFKSHPRSTCLLLNLSLSLVC